MQGDLFGGLGAVDWWALLEASVEDWPLGSVSVSGRRSDWVEGVSALGWLVRSGFGYGLELLSEVELERYSRMSASALLFGVQGDLFGGVR